MPVVLRRLRQDDYMSTYLMLACRMHSKTVLFQKHWIFVEDKFQVVFLP